MLRSERMLELKKQIKELRIKELEIKQDLKDMIEELEDLRANQEAEEN